MEESIGYEALFSAEEWDAIQTSDWSGMPPGGWGDPEEVPPWERPRHRVSVMYPPGTHDGNEERYELECDVCDYIGEAETLEEGQAIARLHEAFVATLADDWNIDR